jgi:biopolymer transport protein ExbB/TolQ
MKPAIVIVSIIALVLAGLALYLLSANTKMRNELNAKISGLEEQINLLTLELEARVAEVSQEKEDEISRLKGTYETLMADMKEEIEQAWWTRYSFRRARLRSPRRAWRYWTGSARF